MTWPSCGKSPLASPSFISAGSSRKARSTRSWPTTAWPRSISATAMERLTMPDPKAILSIEGLRSGYGGKPVLQSVDLSVRDRQITAVIGRNGVGKSTLMKTVIGLLAATAGAVRFNGEEIGGETPHVRARRGIGYVPQGREVFPRMSVEENLLVGLSISGRRTDD